MNIWYLYISVDYTISWSNWKMLTSKKLPEMAYFIVHLFTSMYYNYINLWYWFLYIILIYTLTNYIIIQYSQKYYLYLSILLTIQLENVVNI